VDGVTPLDAVHMNALDQGVVNAVDVDNVAAAASQIVANKLLATDAQPSFRINGLGSIAWGPGGATAPDTNLYRAGATVLKTDGRMVAAEPSYAFLANQAAAGGYAFASYIGADANARFSVLGSSGRLDWGAGGASAVDTNLYRASTAFLKTDGSFAAGQSVIVDAANGSNKLYFGSALDTYLNRWTANTLNTPGSMYFGLGSLAGNTGIYLYDNAAAGQPRLAMFNHGYIMWGPGTAGTDTNLYRKAAAQLQTDGQFYAGADVAATADVWGRFQQATQVKAGDTGSGVPGIVFGNASDTSLFRNGAGVLRTPGHQEIGGNLNLYTAGAVLYFTSDTNLYRSAAGVLRTDAYFSMYYGISMDLGGGGAKIFFGASSDTNIYRSAANTLKTDGVMYIARELVVGSSDAAGVKMYFGSALDTSLYRSAANALATGSYFQQTIAGPASLQSATILNFNGVGARYLEVGGADSGGGGYRMVRVAN
jgi:hypothetical protein